MTKVKIASMMFTQMENNKCGIGNREIKFRAVISPSTTIYFTLKDLLYDKFSIREVLKPWLLENNQDIYNGLKDKNGKEIYEADIIKMSIDRIADYNLNKKK